MYVWSRSKTRQDHLCLALILSPLEKNKIDKLVFEFQQKKKKTNGCFVSFFFLFFNKVLGIFRKWLNKERFLIFYIFGISCFLVFWVMNIFFPTKLNLEKYFQYICIGAILKKCFGKLWSHKVKWMYDGIWHCTKHYFIWVKKSLQWLWFLSEISRCNDFAFRYVKRKNVFDFYRYKIYTWNTTCLRKNYDTNTFVPDIWKV